MPEDSPQMSEMRLVIETFLVPYPSPTDKYEGSFTDYIERRIHFADPSERRAYKNGCEALLKLSEKSGKEVLAQLGIDSDMFPSKKPMIETVLKYLKQERD